ncbi:MAG TPA: hypothetical protein VJ840_17425, partial [Gemmatimonadaceae bacterium]|nr:hypothetical protein [Gemmatimonadaceae bacterium]
MILVNLGLILSLALKPGPVVSYTVTLNPADTSSISVAMVIQIPQSPTTRVAMAVHPEYNDRFWRYVRDLRAESDGKPVAITSESDHSWRVSTPGSRTTVTYRIQLPPESPTNRPVWHTTFRSNGASINSTDTFLYLADFPQSIVAVAFRVPENWQIRSGLSCTFTRIAPGTRDCAGNSSTGPITATMLLDSPILLGDLHTWSFQVQRVPHDVVYWALPNTTKFDTTAFVDALKRYTEQTFALFGTSPYRHYTFLFEDGAYGGLEHRNSVNIGAQSSDLARDPHALMGEIAHEFFHTWNLMALNPRGILLATANPPLHTSELWWSEGMTMYYAETLQRRAGIPEDGKTRMRALQDQIDIFHGNVG